MQGTSAVLNVMTLPPGATKTQQRLVFDGIRGAIFLYENGGPLGALVGSVARTAGTDPYGNVYYAGECAYQANGTATATLISQLFDGSLRLGTGSQFAGTGGATPAGQTTATGGAGSQLIIASGLGSSTDSQNLTNVNSQDAGGGNTPFTQFLFPIQIGASLTGPPTGGLGMFLWSNANGTPSATTPAGVSGAFPVTQSDTASFTVTQAALTQISNIWPVPANDAATGTVYRLTVAGNGTWGTTQQALTFDINAWGTGGVVSVPIGATELPAGAAFDWRAVVDVIVSAAGSAGSLKAGASVTLAQNANNQLTNAGTTNSAGAFTAFTDTTAVDTSTASNITLQAKWASTTGAPVIRSHYSVFERLGA